MNIAILRTIRHMDVRIGSWVKVAVSLMVVAVAVLVVPATPAAAHRLDVRVTQSVVNMRACAWTNCTVVNTAHPGHELVSWCYRNGQNVSGTPYWDVVSNTSTGYAGFISEWLLNDSSQSDTCESGRGGLYNHTTSNGVNIRACASTSCAHVNRVNTGHTLYSYCYVSGQTIHGNPYWDVVYNVSTGYAGYITEHYLTDKSQSTPC